MVPAPAEGPTRGAPAGRVATRWAYLLPFAGTGDIDLPLAVDLGVLAEALMALSSTVALDAHGVWLELGGSVRLLGPGDEAEPEVPMETVARKALAIARALGFEAKVAVADRTATARLLARTGPRPLTVVAEGGDAEALAPLPLDVVGASPMALAYLDRLGVRTLGALRRVSETALVRRVGPEAAELVRLARAEPTPPPRRFVPPEQPSARVELEPPLAGGEPVVFVVKRLLDELELRLGGRGLAVSALRLSLSLEGGASRVEELLLPRPMRSARSLLALLRERLCNRHEDLVAAGSSPFEIGAEGSRVTSIEARVLRAAPAPSAQPSLLDRGREAETEELPALLARLAATLGVESVHGAALVATFKPEGSWEPAPLRSVPPGAGKPRRRAMHAEALATDPVEPLETVEPPSPRPVFLLPEPLEVSGSLEPGRPLEWDGDRGVVLRAWGPERLRGEWWATPFERDYYVVDLEDGERIWVYRDGRDGRLLLHGIFD